MAPDKDDDVNREGGPNGGHFSLSGLFKGTGRGRGKKHKRLEIGKTYTVRLVSSDSDEYAIAVSTCDFMVRDSGNSFVVVSLDKVAYMSSNEIPVGDLAEKWEVEIDELSELFYAILSSFEGGDVLASHHQALEKEREE